MINKIAYLAPKGKPEQLVVFLHGFGSNKDDLISLSEEFIDVLPNALYVSPNAPYECDFMANGYSWFSLDGVNLNNTENAIPTKTKEQLSSSVKGINKFIDKMLEEYKISPENVYLIGFSQGATISIYTAVKRDVPVKAVLAYSGICFDSLEIKSKPDTVGIIHGKLDDVVPFAWHKKNFKSLKDAEINAKQLGIENAYHEIPLEAVEFGKVILKESL